MKLAGCGGRSMGENRAGPGAISRRGQTHEVIA